MNYFLFLLFFICFHTQTSSDVFHIMNSENSTHHSHHSSPPFLVSVSHHNQPQTQTPSSSLYEAECETDLLFQIALQKQHYYNPSVLPKNDPYHPDYVALQNKNFIGIEPSPQKQKTKSQLSQNIVHLSKKAASLPNYKEIKQLKNEIHDTCNLANQAEQQGATRLASRLFDWGNSLFNCAQAIAEGVKEGTINSINACLHPIKTIQNIALSVVEAGKALALLANECMIISHYNDMGCDDLLEEKFHSYDEKIAQLYAYFSSFSKEEILKQATSLGVEALLLNKIIGSLCKFTKLSSEKLITFIETTSENSELAYAIEGVPFKISATANDYIKAMALEGETAVPKSRGKIPKPFKGKAQKWIPLEVELPYLKTRFDFIETGWGPLEGIKLHGGYEHILRGRPTLNKNKNLVGLSGFHHDSLETITKNIKHLQGISLEVLSKEKGIGETYKLIFKGYDRKIPKTFFPSTWTYEQVFEKIYEAIRYAKKNNIPFKSDKNYFNIRSLTKENIEIMIVLNKKGCIITAYPII